MILVVGEILYDVFPDYKRLGGAPFNFAFHLKNLGFPVRFVSRVGNDADGKDIIGKLEQFGFNLDDIQIDPTRPTGSVQVRLDENGVPNFKITPDVAYDYIEFERKVHAPLIQTSELIYYGSLVQRKAPGFKTIQAILTRKSPSARCFYDINLRPACYNHAVVLTSLSQTNVLKINKIIDSVGAGDAYAAMLAAGILRQWHPETIVHRASLFASQICKIEGAIPESVSFYEPFTGIIKG